MTAVALPQPDGPLSWLAFQVRLTANETAKGMRLMWRRRGLLATFIVMIAVEYLLITLFIGGGHLVKSLVALTFSALLGSAVAVSAALQGTGGIAEEINGGTLEQSQLSPASPTVLVLGRVLALAIEGVLAAVVLGVVLGLALGLRYDPNPAVLIPAALTIADGIGYGLVLTALTVRVASIGAVTHVLNMAVKYFGGMIVPIAMFPPALEVFAKFMPIALGVQAMNTTLTGSPLSAVWADGTLPWLLVHAAASLALGWVLYASNIRRARREGGLSPR